MTACSDEYDPLDLIVAVGRNNLIGTRGGHLGLPWHIPEDLKNFRKRTLRRPIIMGRTTFTAIGRPLPKRRNIVLSRTRTDLGPDVEVCASLEDALSTARVGGIVPMIIGGASVYAAALPLVMRIYMTHVDREAEGDTYFPVLGDEFVEIERVAAQTAGVTFSILERK